MNIFDVIKKPLVTEKTTLEKDAKNIISFAVNSDANKIEIKEAVEKFFKVEVVNVNTINVAGKNKRVAEE
jgi:large subunit ribosomal protein L23